MHLADAPAASASDLQRTVGDSLDGRLLRDSARPIAVALSGGGDSLALLLIAAEWARAARRPLRVLTVDHGLRPESSAWTEACAATAARLALPFRALAWNGGKPATGLPAAARDARHALLADAAREAGARVILLGHTADDILEARLMREAGATTPEPREWAPSPAWPQGRGVFLLRPMLRVRRSALRAWLTARGEAWIDDPANEDQAYARPRARQALAGGATPAPPDSTTSAKALALACRGEADGGLVLDRAILRDAPPDAQARFASAACLCAAGTARPPGREKITRLLGRLAGEDPVTASLAGARVEANETHVRFRREPGEAARGGLAPLALAAGEAGVWDGRFEITAKRAVQITPLKRTATPVATDTDDEIVAVETTPLAHARLLAACGAVEAEPA